MSVYQYRPKMSLESVIYVIIQLLNVWY